MIGGRSTGRTGIALGLARSGSPSPHSGARQTLLSPTTLKLIDALRRPEAYTHAANDLDVRHTHASVVFLAGPYAYKVKKPVNLGFLDFSTLERRLHFCREEVRLNRRLAPGVYLGVEPITAVGDRIVVGGDGRVIEYAVKMERLPDEATLHARLRAGEVGEAPIRELARRIAAFHARADRGPHIARFGQWDVIAGNARENFEQTRTHVGTSISESVWRRIQALNERRLDDLRPLIDRRADEGIPRDTHGDLHLQHVYWFPEREPPGNFSILDCIEFNERFRYSDPVADVAFLAMDLAFHARRDLARCLAAEYFAAAGDADGVALLPFYVAYRAVVRAKVEGITAMQSEVPAAERDAAARRAHAHWLLGLVELEEPNRRPCLILVMGLPGSGKSTLARGLAERGRFRVVSSDLVRKELAGLAPDTPAPAPFGKGLYTEAWHERTYRECLVRAERLLCEGHRVIIDASFREEARRRACLLAAAEGGVPALAIQCTAPADVARDRLRDRTRGASDADQAIRERMAEIWEPPSPATARVLREVPTTGGKADSLERALAHLREAQLAR